MGIRKYIQNDTARRPRVLLSLRQYVRIILNRAVTAFALGKPGLLNCWGWGAENGKTPGAGSEALTEVVTAGRRQALARLWGRRPAEGLGRGGRQAPGAPGLGRGLGGGCSGRCVRSGRASPSASSPRPASSPYHVAPPHVEEVSVHHGAVAAAFLRHAEQL